MLPRNVDLPMLFLWLLVVVVIGWCAHLLAAYKLIDLAFDAPDSFLAESLMPGRESIARERYYRQADAFAVNATLLAIATSVVAALLLYKPLGALLFVFSCFASTLLLFLIFEKIPSLIPLARLDSVLGYYAYKVNYLPDAQLGYREKPFNRSVIRGFTGTGFSPHYRIDVQPYTIEWIMDRDGFRNPSAGDSADMIVLGDSYIEYGFNAADTFVGRMQRELAHLRLLNFGKSGYTIAQYIRVLDRFGLRYQPRLVVLAIYEGNDVSEMRDYLLWKSGRARDLSGGILKFATDSVFQRYIAAAGSTAAELKKTIRVSREILLDRLALRRDQPLPIHPDIALVKLHDRTYPKLFIDKLPTTTAAQMLAGEEFKAIRDLLVEFKEICGKHHIAPLILYIPTAAHIYAEYSAPESGRNWLRIREGQIAARKNVETAIQSLVEDTGLPFLSLAPLFESAAARGRMLYYPLDAHWNAEGREVAAQYLARIVKQRYLPIQGDPSPVESRLPMIRKSRWSKEK